MGASMTVRVTGPLPEERWRVVVFGIVSEAVVVI